MSKPTFDLGHFCMSTLGFRDVSGVGASESVANSGDLFSAGTRALLGSSVAGP